MRKLFYFPLITPLSFLYYNSSSLLLYLLKGVKNLLYLNLLYPDGIPPFLSPIIYELFTDETPPVL